MVSRIVVFCCFNRFADSPFCARAHHFLRGLTIFRGRLTIFRFGSPFEFAHKWGGAAGGDRKSHVRYLCEVSIVPALAAPRAGRAQWTFHTGTVGIHLGYIGEGTAIAS